MQHAGHADGSGTFDVRREVVDEDARVRRHPETVGRQPVDLRLGLSKPHLPGEDADGCTVAPHVFEMRPVLTPCPRAVRTASIIASSGLISANRRAVRPV